MLESYAVPDFCHKISGFAIYEAKLAVASLKPGDAKRIVKAFEARQDKETQLKKFDLRGNNIGNTDMTVIIEGIQKLPRLCQTLEILDLRGNPLSEEIGELLVNFVRKTSNLKQLEFNAAALKPEHRDIIANTLASRQAESQHQHNENSAIISFGEIPSANFRIDAATSLTSKPWGRNYDR